jgi:hypothetical protein
MQEFRSYRIGGGMRRMPWFGRSLAVAAYWCIIVTRTLHYSITPLLPCLISPSIPQFLNSCNS